MIGANIVCIADVKSLISSPRTRSLLSSISNAITPSGIRSCIQ